MSARNGFDRMPDLRGLSRTLDAQDRALANGDLGALPGIAERIAALCDRIESRSGDARATELAVASDLRLRAGRTLRDLSATLAGLRDASALLDSARSPRDDATYGADGQRCPLARPTSRLERRT